MADNNSLAFLPFIKRQLPLMFTDGQSGHLAATLDIQAVDAHGTHHNVASHEVRLRGPGDILGISRNMIARLEPPPDANDFEPNYFPFVEFVDPDFCWRYSLDGVSSNTRKVHPWLSLIVLSATEMEEMSNAGIEVISAHDNSRNFLSIQGRYLPELKNAWGTAHVHLSNLKKPVLEFVDNHPDSHCCRLFCLRKLQANTRYTAFLVPNYEMAVKAAFGLSQNQGSNKKAWVNPNDDDIIKLPIYFSWSFSTSESGDFESLARKLKPSRVDADRVGTRAVDANRIAPGLEPRLNRYFLREGALAPPNFSAIRQSYACQQDRLPSVESTLDLLNESLRSYVDLPSGDLNENEDEDPLVTLPVYGRYFRNTSEIKLPQGDQWPGPTPWIHELNLDVRYRVAAALGTRVVQENQEQYMQDCWAQVGEIRKANEKLRLTQVGYIMSRVIERKHLNPLSDERFALVSAPFHAHVAANDRGTSVSMRRELADSGISPGVYSSTFKRVSNRRIGIRTVKPSSAIEKAKNPAAVSVHRSPVTFTAASTVLSATLDMGTTIGMPIKKQKTEIIPIKDIKLDSDFRKKFNIGKVLQDKLRATIVFTGNQTIPDEFGPIMAHPVIDRPMYRPLARLSRDYVIPGIENIGNNGVTLLEENRRFIEAYMAGVNHEMGRELIWRNYPIWDRRGTIFSYFWDQVVADQPEPDIQKIHTWTQPLGHNDSKGGDNLVLVIKGDLIRRYPNTIVYVIAFQGKGTYWSDVYPDSSPELDDTHHIDPIIRARIGADILCVGFPFSKDDVLGQDQSCEFYFVLQEHHDLPRFGLDVASNRPVPENCSPDVDVNELSWADVVMDKAGYIRRFKDFDPASITSATIANITYQLPIRVAIHASELLVDEG